MAVVNRPIFFDLVHPANEIIVIKDIIPKRNVIAPIRDGIIKSPFAILKGNPSVVIINTFVMANTETKKKLAAKTAAFIKFPDNLVLVFDTKKLAIMAMENPPNKELITTT